MRLDLLRKIENIFPLKWDALKSPYLLRTAKDIYYGLRRIKTVYFSFVPVLVEFNRIETFLA